MSFFCLGRRTWVLTSEARIMKAALNARLARGNVSRAICVFDRTFQCRSALKLLQLTAVLAFLLSAVSPEDDAFQQEFACGRRSSQWSVVIHKVMARRLASASALGSLALAPRLNPLHRPEASLHEAGSYQSIGEARPRALCAVRALHPV